MALYVILMHVRSGIDVSEVLLILILL